MTLPDPHWRKAKASQGQTNCVEVASSLDALRDSKNPDGPVLHVGELSAFISAIKNDQLSY